MSVVNLNTARKAAARDAAGKQADANAVKFGRTKAEKALEAARNLKAAHDLDGHQRNGHQRDGHQRDTD